MVGADTEVKPTSKTYQSVGEEAQIRGRRMSQQQDIAVVIVIGLIGLSLPVSGAQPGIPSAWSKN